ncbi:MAG TPA: IS200/IS605 family transposase [Candidatus Acidoferrum sp.]|nr:IS200/IS605 family transposase [Candidatus Acidoferrum sp.]
MSYVSSYFHCVFGTKERRKYISPALQERLWPFLVGIARDKGMTCIIAGGTDDHVHLLLDLPAIMPVSKAMQLIKGAPSKWIHETFPDQRLFAWQEEYGAFSVSVSQLETIKAYIKNQKEHHRRRSFQEEFLMLLKKHRVKFDERYLWD